MHFINQYKGLPRSIYMLVIARIINNMGYFVHPFLTLFMSARLGLDTAVIGRNMLILACMFVPSAMLAGKLADHFKRKNLYLWAQLFGNLLVFACGFLGNSITVVYLCMAAAFFFGMMGPINSAMTMDLTTPENRRESMSLIYLGMNLGVAIGPLFAGILFDKYTPWLFWLDGISGFFAMLIILLFVPDTTPTKKHIEEINADQARLQESSEKGSAILALLSRPVLLAFILIDLLLSFSYAQTGFLVPLHAEEVFGIATGAKYYGYMMALNGFVVVVFTAFLVVLTKRISTILNIALASLFFAAGFALYAYCHSLIGFLFCTFLWTTGEILSATNMGVYIANHTPVTHRARFQSIVDILGGTGRAIGPAVIGVYLMTRTIASAWLLIGGLCMIAAILYLGLDFIDKKGSKNGHITESITETAS